MSVPQVSQDDHILGKVVQGRFRVISRLAAGGMGVVYKAEQIPLGRTIAFKVLESKHNPQLDESFSKRFFLEASAAARLAHPNTIVVHDYGKTDEGLYFIAMEFLEGGSLAGRLKKQGPLTPAQAIHVGLQICGSLRDAHAQGLVHRDLKPANVMFAPRGGDPFFCKVLDFGLVKVLGEQDPENLGLTQSGVMMGSPRYMAPEQVKAQACDHRADIYAFGAVLYHMLTGAPPFAAGSAFEAMHAHVNTPPPPLRATWPGCPAGAHLEALVMRCLEKHVDARPSSMDEVMYGLKMCEAEAGTLSLHGGGYGGSYASQQGQPIIHNGNTGNYAAQSGVDSSPSITPSVSVSMGGRSGVSMAGRSMSASASMAGTNKTVMFDQGITAAHASLPPPAPVPQREGSGLGMKLVIGLLTLLVIGAGGFAIVLFLPALLDQQQATARVDLPVRAARIEAPPPPRAPEPVAVEPTTLPVQQPPVQQPAQQPLAPQQTLTLRTDPSGARVRREGADLGDTPVALIIPQGERWMVEISRDGFQTRVITIAAGQPELMVHLEPEEQGRPIHGRPRPQQPQIVQQPQVISPQPQPLGGTSRPRPRGNVYAPDLNDPWAGR
jgi:serine/threonine protein kinase